MKIYTDPRTSFDIDSQNLPISQWNVTPVASPDPREVGDTLIEDGESEFFSVDESEPELSKTLQDIPVIDFVVTREWCKSLRTLVLEAYGGKCCHCGFKDTRCLQIDHINGGGTKHRKEIALLQGRWTNIYTWLRDKGYPKDCFQLLCANCNWIKRFENSEYSGSQNVWDKPRKT